MVKVCILYEQNIGPVGFVMKGHAGYDKAGKDIVCAAVSALAFSCIGSIEELTSDAIRYEAAEDGGLLRFRFLNQPSHDGSLLLRSLEKGLLDIQTEYGKSFIQVSFRMKVGTHEFLSFEKD